MANEIRQRRPFGGGLVDDNPLGSGATTLTSTGLSTLFELGTTLSAHIAIVLDPDGTDGDPETAYITAYTNGATTATIARGKEGTTARAHAQNTPWIAAIMHSDFPTWITKARTVGDGDKTITSTTFADLDTTDLRITLPYSYAGQVIVAELAAYLEGPAVATDEVRFDFDVGGTLMGAASDGVAVWQGPVRQSIIARGVYPLTAGGSQVITAQARVTSGQAVLRGDSSYPPPRLTVMSLFQGYDGI
jgi:hypothetical protein